MTQAKNVPPTSFDAVRMMSVLHQLTLESVLAEDRKELIFRILNRSVTLCPYDRASMWLCSENRPKLLGVSGKSSVDRFSELAEQWRALIETLPEPNKHMVVSEAVFETEEHKAAWREVADKTSGLSVLWLAIHSRKKHVAGLWLERWGDKQWQAGELKVFQPLALGYGAAWEKLDHSGLARRMAARIMSRRGLVALLALLAVLLVFLRLSLRVVAPCDVVPKDPVVVTAPLNGVVGEVMVEPGQKVHKGDLLFVYDKRVALKELEVADKQVEIIESSLKRSRMLAFRSDEARAEIAILVHRLEQEQAKLELARYRVSQLEVTAGLAGQVVMGDPNEWRGRPVMVGERVLMLVEPDRSKLKIWLPDDDNLLFDAERPVKVYLNAFPDKSLRAELAYVAPNVTQSLNGTPSVLAEAEWINQQHDLKIGLQGTAVLYGEDVPLIYWLARKPWSWVNRAFGF